MAVKCINFSGYDFEQAVLIQLSKRVKHLAVKLTSDGKRPDGLTLIP